jgi:hypothetical protein
MPRKGEVPKRDSLPDPKYTEAPIDVRKLAPGEYTLAIRNARWSWSTYRVFLD